MHDELKIQNYINDLPTIKSKKIKTKSQFLMENKVLIPFYKALAIAYLLLHYSAIVGAAVMVESESEAAAMGRANGRFC